MRERAPLPLSWQTVPYCADDDKAMIRSLVFLPEQSGLYSFLFLLSHIIYVRSPCGHSGGVRLRLTVHGFSHCHVPGCSRASPSDSLHPGAEQAHPSPHCPGNYQKVHQYDCSLYSGSGQRSSATCHALPLNFLR